MKLKVNFLVLFSAATVNLLAFTTGVGYAWTSPMLPKLSGNESSSEANPLGRPATLMEKSWIAGLLPIGGIFGPIVSGYLADKIGRKITIFIMGLPMIASLFMAAFAKIVPLFLLSRFLIGLGCGSVFTVLPMYLLEIAEVHYRGALSSSLHPFMGLGVLFTYCIGPLLSVQNFCLVALIPLFIFAPLCFFMIPESPYYLLTKNREDKARHELIRMRKGKEKEEIEQEILKAKQIIEELSKEKGGLKDLIKEKILRKALIISVILIIIQQWAGIIAVISYMQTIFDAANTGLSPELSSIIVGIDQILAFVLTSSLVDLVGRKLLFLSSSILSCVSLTLLGSFFFFKNRDFEVSSFSFLPLVSLLIFMMAFNLGLGPLPWTVMAEMFPPNVKAAGMTFNGVFCFIQNFAIAFSFPSMAEFFGMDVTFWIFGAVCLAGTAFIFWVVPETKGKSMHTIQRDLGGGL